MLLNGGKLWMVICYYDNCPKLCDALRGMVPFVQSKKREEHTLKSVQALACNFTKSNAPSWEFFMFFKLYKWYQIAQGVSC